MQEIIISLNSNVLKVSTLDSEGSFLGFTRELDKDIVENTFIKDVQAFSGQLDSLIADNIKVSNSKLNLNFILEPEDVFLRFITLPKTEDNFEDEVIKQAEEKLGNVSLDDLYFSYKKIAPFLYQFIGVKKEFLENILQISNLTGISLQSVLPWNLLLPKYTGTTEPSIFVTKRNNGQAISLGELSGVFFSEVYDKDRSSEELAEYVKELSFYKRSQPIDKIYSLNYESFDIEGFEVINVEPPVIKDQEKAQKEYSINLIANYLIDTDAALLTSQINLLNLLPLPAVKEKNTTVLVASSIVAVLVLAAAIFAGLSYFSGSENQDTFENEDVLSETAEVEESTPSVEEEQSQEELERKDLSIRVENGAGVNGLAARTQTLLQDSGYEVLSIDTADENTEATILKFKPDYVKYSDLVTEDLKENFPEIVIEDTLGEDAEYDLLITAGTTSNL